MFKRKKKVSERDKLQKDMKKFYRTQKRKKITTPIKWVIGTSIMLTLFATTGIGLYYGETFLGYWENTPKLNKDRLKNPLPSKILDSKGNLLAEVGVEEREETDSKGIPKEFYDALIATEDARYFEHNGFDPIRTAGAALKNLKGGSQGGSTLTQQLAKMAFLDPNEHTLRRKIQELKLSLELEKEYSKQEILNLYINRIYMGDGVYGAETAAKHYYGKPLNELDLPQLSLLAGIPQSPNEYNPFENPEGAKYRRDVVMYRLWVTDYFGLHESKEDKDQKTVEEAKKKYEELKAIPVEHGLADKAKARAKSKFNIPKQYRQYIDKALDEVRELTDLEPFLDGLTITTAIDTSLQDFSNEVANTNNYIPYASDKMLVGFTIIENSSGKVLANGSGNRETEVVANGYNYAMDSQRQAASTMKPILSYAPAVEYLQQGTGTIVSDTQHFYKDGGMELNNWDMQHMGNMKMRDALAQSRNIPAVRELNAVGMDRAYNFANNLGMEFQPADYVESGPLGSVSNSNSFKMASAYSAFARGGTYVKGYLVSKVTDKDGVDVIISDKQPKPKKVMKESTAFIITTALKDTMKTGTGISANSPNLTLAGKTGTSNYEGWEFDAYGIPNGHVPDSWFVGYSPKYTVAVWVGYDKRQDSLSFNEQSIAMKIFKTVMEKLPENNGNFKVPENIKKTGSDFYPTD